MIKIKFLTVILVTIITSATCVAMTLDEQIKHFLFDQFTEPPEKITLHYLQPYLPIQCKTPYLRLINNKKVGGKMTLIAECGAKKQFIQLNVEVKGNYVAASHAIPAGTLLTDQDIYYEMGRWDRLSETVMRNKEQVIGKIALQPLQANKPIKSTSLRKKPVLTAGQLTRILIRGKGYQIVTQGKALTNAGLNDLIKARVSSSSKVISGLATEEGILVLNEK